MGLDTRREGCDFFRQPCLVKTVPHLFLVDAVHGLGHILGHRAGEHAEILKDRFKQLVVIPAVILPDILPVQQNTPPGGVKEAADQLDQCRLASAIQAHDGQVLAGVQCQAHVGDGVFLRTGVAVAHILQLQLIGHIQPLFQRDALLKPEGFRQLEELPDGGDVQALLAQEGKLLHQACDPLGKAGGRTEVEQEFRHRQAPGHGEPEQISIGRTVAHQQQGQVDEVGGQVGALPLFEKGIVEPQSRIVQVSEPLPQAEDADILAELASLGGVAQVMQAPGDLCPLLPVAVAPLVDIPGGKIAHHSGQGRQDTEPGVQPG